MKTCIILYTNDGQQWPRPEHMIKGTFVLPSIEISLSLLRSLILLCGLTEGIGELYFGPEQELTRTATKATEIPLY